jgi:hypothetical protein
METVQNTGCIFHRFLLSYLGIIWSQAGYLGFQVTGSRLKSTTGAGAILLEKQADLLALILGFS